MKTKLKEGKNGSGKTMEAPMKVKILMPVFFFLEQRITKNYQGYEETGTLVNFWESKETQLNITGRKLLANIY